MTIRNVIYLLIEDYWKNVQGGKLCSLAPLTGKENKFAALIHFKEYAYERNISGAASVYKEVADNALSFLETGGWSSDTAEAKIWRNFREECKRRGKEGIKTNVRVNPLGPSIGEKKSLFAFVRSRPNHETIAAWAFRMISKAGWKKRILPSRRCGGWVIKLHLSTCAIFFGWAMGSIHR